MSYRCNDPTGTEMEKFLEERFNGQYDDFDSAEAIYWFCSDYHSGQSSNLYSVLSVSDFSPSMSSRGPSSDGMAKELYNALVKKFVDLID